LEDYGGSLRPSVRARIGEAITIARDQLTKWGVDIRPRQANPSDRLNTEALGLDRYENERPDEGSACRFGDARVLNQWIER
jgi:hydrogenase maturation protease